MAGSHAGLFELDLAFADQLGERLLEGGHPLALAERDLVIELLHLVVADVAAHREGGEHQLHRRHAAAAVGARHQLLRDDGVERQGELLPDLRLLVGREDVDDPVHRLHRVVRVQRGEHQVPGLGGGDRRRHGLEVAHLADQDDVRVLAQRRPQRLAERAGVAPHLDVLDQRAVRAVLVLDRVLDGDDVGRAGAVDLADQRRQRGRLAGAGGAGHQHQAAVGLHQLGQPRRQVEAGQGGDVARQDAQRRRQLAALAMEVDPEPPGAAGRAVRKRRRHSRLELARSPRRR